MRRQVYLGALAAAVAAIVLALGSVTISMAQEQRGDRGPRGQFDPAQFLQRRMDAHKEQAKINDEEWQVIEPLLKDVMEKQTQQFRGRGFGRRPGGQGGPGAPAGMPEVEALQKALESEATPADEIKAKMKALRDARAKAEKDLQDAREKLRKVLTVRQEAQFVLMGTLD